MYLLFLIIGQWIFPGEAFKQLSIEITQLRNNKGHVLVSIFDKADGFPGNPNKAVRKEKIAIKEGVASINIDDLPAGDYAIAILHDENDNLRMDKSLGIPKEGYGFSNNARGIMGPPPFTKARFRLEGSKRIEIKARY